MFVMLFWKIIFYFHVLLAYMIYFISALRAVILLHIGTGKSKTGARIAYLLASKHCEKVLFCGPTNTAVDTVASKLTFVSCFL